MSLHLGEEIFDIHTMPIQGDFNHLFVRQGTGLQGQSIFKTKLSFRYDILWTTIDSLSVFILKYSPIMMTRNVTTYDTGLTHEKDKLS